MQDYLYNNKKKVLIVGLIVLILIIGISIYGIVRNMLYSATVSITVAPSVAKVYIDGKEYGSIGEYKLKPGEYEVEAVADGFQKKAGHLVAVANETVNISMYLEPTAENSDWYLEHPEDALTMGDIKADEAAKVIEQLAEKHPILKQLPIEVDYFSDDYSKRTRYTISYLLAEDNTSFTITITDYTGGNQKDALEKLKARGVNLDDYEIDYTSLSKDSEWGHAG